MSEGAGAGAARPAGEPTLRPARPADAATLVEFNRRLARETEGKELDLATLARGVEALLRDERLGRYVVAEAGGEVVGQVMTTQEWSDWRAGSIWWLQSVYVRADWRGRGVFDRLLAEVAARARAEGAIGLRLYVEDHNERAQATYRRNGFVDAGYRVLERIPL